RQLFEMLDDGTETFNELVVAASAKIKRPKTSEQADTSIGYTGPAQGENSALHK
ncbi:MAG: formate dehydrogenase, partial [Mesorhizobium sp.]